MFAKFAESNGPHRVSRHSEEGGTRGQQLLAVIVTGLTPGRSGKARERRTQGVHFMSAAPGIQTVNEHLKWTIGGKWKRAKKKKKNGKRSEWSVVAAGIKACRRGKSGTESSPSVAGDPSRCASTKGSVGTARSSPIRRQMTRNDGQEQRRTIRSRLRRLLSPRARGLHIMAAVVEAHYLEGAGPHRASANRSSHRLASAAWCRRRKR